MLSPRSAESSSSRESPSEMIKAGSGLSGCTQIVPEVASANLSLPELAQPAPVGSSMGRSRNCELARQLRWAKVCPKRALACWVALR